MKLIVVHVTDSDSKSMIETSGSHIVRSSARDYMYVQVHVHTFVGRVSVRYGKNIRFSINVTISEDALGCCSSYTECFRTSM